MKSNAGVEAKSDLDPDAYTCIFGDGFIVLNKMDM